MIKMQLSSYEAIESMLRDAFPGRKVRVMIEKSILFWNMISVKAQADDSTACVTVSSIDTANEGEIALELISMLQNEIEK